jgi:hypothetical protein
MSSWGQDFLNGFGEGFFSAPGLKDYSHASKTFRSNGYELAPRQKFLFHVYFNLNTAQVPVLKNIFPGTANGQTVLGLLVKNIQLPSYQISVDTLNQYNRKRLVQSKIEYQPVKIDLHDDGGDNIRNMWYNYFSYYYKDPSQKYDNSTPTNGSLFTTYTTPVGFDYNSRDIYANDRNINDWGYVGENYTDGYIAADAGSKPAFFKDIRIYGFDQHKFAAYVLINPMITDFSHDTYDYAQGNGTMSNTMTIRYETVKYYSGAIGAARPDNNAIGFADPAYYDLIRSGISRPGSTASVLGQGGLLDTGIGIYEDLASGGVGGAIGAIQKAGTLFNTFKNKDIRSVVNQEAYDLLNTTIRQSLPGAVRGAIGQRNNPNTGQASGGNFGGQTFPTPVPPEEFQF